MSQDLSFNHYFVHLFCDINFYVQCAKILSCTIVISRWNPTNHGKFGPCFYFLLRFNLHNCLHCLHQLCSFLYLDKKEAIEHKLCSKIKPYLGRIKRGLWLRILYQMQMFSGNDFEAKMCHLVHHSCFAVYHGTAAHRNLRSRKFSIWPQIIAFGSLLECSPRHFAQSYLRFPSKLWVSLNFFQFGNARFEKEKTPIKVYD